MSGDRVRPCLCGFEADTPNKMFYHRRFCAVWKARDRDQVRHERFVETMHAKGFASPRVSNSLCPGCHRQLTLDKQGRLREGHAEDCPAKPLFPDIPANSQQRHAMVLGSNEVLQGLVQALAHHEVKPSAKVHVSQVLRNKRVGRSYKLFLDCGHTAYRCKPTAMIVCALCGSGVDSSP